jgi:hypothetical protein
VATDLPVAVGGRAGAAVVWTGGGRHRWGASFLADLGHEIPTALLPSLLTSTLRAPASALGLIEGISDAAAGIVDIRLSLVGASRLRCTYGKAANVLPMTYTAIHRKRGPL